LYSAEELKIRRNIRNRERLANDPIFKEKRQVYIKEWSEKNKDTLK